ncbi:uncharacterized protein BDCG_06810 [Blastomyces dermatitidis ER-3]|uniref:Uncharacterized protein n=2 Tax=Ajellomyces dermatitidis TaxID=5039 RepID=A0A0J9ES13_AJEDA|nr:uncharacterized protein BDCG_06810 [Blastomyces dermatitidis ER-3]EEQ91690.1 hypothetical protein BDCG_06810 [Blastomyces dermatitidis ER-3]EQL31848.1 hypothetical protein BDFG_05896 [Blastomyces dermatitidis ATCC 26199]KMW67965.1 hypothetical protein BDDG_12472 [Blastomyces dermatitidis ATCC 18188]
MAIFTTILNHSDTLSPEYLRPTKSELQFSGANVVECDGFCKLEKMTAIADHSQGFVHVDHYIDWCNMYGVDQLIQREVRSIVNKAAGICNQFNTRKRLRNVS